MLQGSKRMVEPILLMLSLSESRASKSDKQAWQTSSPQILKDILKCLFVQEIPSKLEWGSWKRWPSSGVTEAYAETQS